jgi:DNA-binding NarL/FixJ family response regulator
MTTFCAEGSEPGKSPAIRILIVEDHEPTVEAVTALLQGTLGRTPPVGRALAVRAVRDAESALESIINAPPDVVVMDISLPGMNGIEATRRLRDIAPAIPVIIHSRNDTEVYRTMACEAGVRAFVSKQRTAQELVFSIRRVLQSEAG